jgi:methyl halide transferase
MSIIETGNGNDAGNRLGQSFWNQQYKENTTGWDLGEVSPPLKAYIDQLTNKDLRILIPGCGNSYEASYLLQQGFTNITVIDIAPELVARLKNKFAGEPRIKIILDDFFRHEGQYDLVLEQTFYAYKMQELLAPGGKLAGLLFSREFDQAGPPFGGSEGEYRTIFGKTFGIKTMTPCYNSFTKRRDTELFIILQGKN